MSIRIMLVDDHGIIRDGLRSLLEKQDDVEVVAEADDGRKAIALVREHQPDVVIMDISMPGLNGIDASRRIVADNPEVKIITLSIHSNRRFVSDMLKAGASGYVLKECLFDELVQAVRTVAAGDIYLSPRITGVVVDDYVEHLSSDTQRSKLAALSEREREVLQMLAEGKSTKNTALTLHVSPKTIESNRRRIMEKLDIHSVAELTKYAIREGLTSLES